MLISQFIAEYRGGILDEMMGRELQEVAEGAEKYCKPGELKITIKIKPENKGAMSVAIKHDKKVPQRNVTESIMFLTPENNLVNYDPQQPSFFEPNNNGVLENRAQKVKAL